VGGTRRAVREDARSEAAVKPDRTACITLLTDYGLEAGFVGALHAVAFGLAPSAAVIDLDHSVPRGEVRVGAWRLEHLTRLVPGGVHVAVVDPGVGSSRLPIALRAGGRLFVGPDNGVLIWAAEAGGGIEEAVVLDDETYFLPDRARTFDGRDVFVPVACRLAEGATVADVGSAIDPLDLVRLERPAARRLLDGSLETEVVQVDGFGNVQLGASQADLGALGLSAGDQFAVESGRERVVATAGSTFSDVGPGEAVLLLDSDGQLALARNGGRADALLPAALGGRVLVRRVGPSPADAGRPT